MRINDFDAVDVAKETDTVISAVSDVMTACSINCPSGRRAFSLYLLIKTKLWFLSDAQYLAALVDIERVHEALEDAGLSDEAANLSNLILCLREEQ